MEVLELDSEARSLSANSLLCHSPSSFALDEIFVALKNKKVIKATIQGIATTSIISSKKSFSFHIRSLESDHQSQNRSSPTVKRVKS